MHDDEPIYTLPPYFAQEAVVALSETIDWSLATAGIPDLQLAGHTGKGVKIAILDTGVDPTHPDLKGALLGYRDFTNEGINDRVGHGTHCAGTILAQRNDIGVRGVAYDAKGCIYKVLTNSGGSDRWIAGGIRGAVEDGCKILSMSLGAPTAGQHTMQAIDEAVAAGCILVCAAGNDGRVNSVNWPAKSRNVIAVSAYDQNFNLAPFSSQGPEVDIAGPGVDILSCYKGGQYVKMSGTSMATPFIAGVVALLVQKHPGLSKVDDVIELLRKGAVDKGAPGQDPQYGWGPVNPREIFKEAPPPLPPIPPQPEQPLPGPGKSVEIKLGMGLVAHIPALPTDLFTAGIALEQGATVNGSYDPVKLLQQLEEAARIANAAKAA